MPKTNSRSTTPKRSASSRTGLAAAPAVASAIAKNRDEAIGFLLKVGIVVGVAGLAWYLLRKKHKPANFDSSKPPSNITKAQAMLRADALYSAMYGIGTNYNVVKQNLQGLNYNAWIMLFNEFGIRQPANPLAEKINLVEWLIDELNDTQLSEIRFMLPYNFF
jgi:hypothetical protein